MFKSTAIVILALAFCISADPIRQKTIRSQVFARQQLQPTAAPAGYALAGVTPAIPFDLPTETEKPVTQQPDEVYGPPHLDAQHVDLEIQPDEVYGPPESEVVQLDEVYGAPDSNLIPEIIRDITVETEEDPEEELYDDLHEDDAVIAISSTFEKPARLVYQRFPQSRQPPKSAPARLTLIRPSNFVYKTRIQNFQRAI